MHLQESWLEARAFYDLSTISFWRLVVAFALLEAILGGNLSDGCVWLSTPSAHACSDEASSWH